jgi:3-mercaptopyruvate sulfurtransferase SseA
VEAYRDRITIDERNQMIQNARKAAEQAALNIDSQMLSRAEQSAKRTLQALARALGVNEEVEVVFRDRSENKIEQGDK